MGDEDGGRQIKPSGPGIPPGSSTIHRFPYMSAASFGGCCMSSRLLRPASGEGDVDENEGEGQRRDAQMSPAASGGGVGGGVVVVIVVAVVVLLF